MTLAAAIPVFNGAATLAGAMASVRAELSAAGASELLAIDDGSSDHSASIAAEGGARVIPLGRNLGRGAARARAMAETAAALVLMCDATVELPAGFLARALPYFENPRVAGVFGNMLTGPPRGVADRWRKRHLFKAAELPESSRQAVLSTWACVLRAEAVRNVGGFDPALRANEDADLGARLLAAGHEVVFSPELSATSLSSNTVRQVLERYVRWNTQERMSWRGYLRQIAYSAKVMARNDLRAGDPLAAAISLLTPHFQFRASWNLPPGKPDR